MTVIERSGDYESGALDALDYITDERPDLEDVTMRAAEKIGANIVAGHRRERGAVEDVTRLECALAQVKARILEGDQRGALETIRSATQRGQ